MFFYLLEIGWTGAGDSRGAGFSLRGFVLARTKFHRLKSLCDN
jgi:hypothetical protein